MDTYRTDDGSSNDEFRQVDGGKGAMRLTAAAPDLQHFRLDVANQCVWTPAASVGAARCKAPEVSAMQRAAPTLAAGVHTH
jgi:hypothetical protein